MTDIEFETLLKISLIKAAELDYMVSIPPEEELKSLVTPSIQFERKMSKLIGNTKSYLRKLSMPVYQRVLRTAAAILLIISTLLGVSMLNPDVRAMVMSFFRMWFSDRTEYEIADGVVSVIPSSVTLGYVPEGFELEFEIYNSFGANLMFRTDGNGYFNIEISGQAGKPHVDNRHSEFYYTAVGDYVVEVYESNDTAYPSTLVCYDERSNLIITVAGTLTIEELINILEGLSF